jgi:hypothetical protein
MMATWSDPCSHCGGDGSHKAWCLYQPRGSAQLALVPEPPAGPNGDAADLDARYRVVRMADHHGTSIAAEWERGTVHGKLICAPMRSLAVPGEPFTQGQWTAPNWLTYLVWADGQDPLDGGLVERHCDRYTGKVSWHPVGSHDVLYNLGDAIRLVLSITDARTWEG